MLLNVRISEPYSRRDFKSRLEYTEIKKWLTGIRLATFYMFIKIKQVGDYLIPNGKKIYATNRLRFDINSFLNRFTQSKALFLRMSITF